MANMLPIKEASIRRKLGRMGYRLSRSRSKNPDENGYGKYAIIDIQTNCTVAGTHKSCRWHEFNLADVEKWLDAMTQVDPHVKTSFSGR